MNIDQLNELPKIWDQLSLQQKKQILAYLDSIEEELTEWSPLAGPQELVFQSEASEILYGGAAGGGKGQSLDTPIPTPSGFKLMQDIAIGDAVFDESGNPCNVIAVSEIQHRRVFKLTFDDGSVIKADDVHRWFTATDVERTALFRLSDEFRKKRKASRKSRAKENSQKPWVSKIITALNKAKEHIYKDPIKGNVRSTLEILNTLRVGKANRANHSIDVAKPLNLPTATLPVDPYTLGVFLGDGASSSGEIGMLQSDLEQMTQYIPYRLAKLRIYGAPTYKQPFAIARFDGLRESLRCAGVLGNKHIPNQYLRASIEQRKELLRGLLDTDGHAAKSGQIEIGLSDKKLADGLFELVLSLGIKAAMTIKKTTHKDSYRIKFLADFPAFKLTRKLNRQKLDNFRDTVKRRYIVDVCEIESEPTKCIAVDSPSHLYLAGRSFIPTHNTDLALGKALKQHKKVLILRREFPQLAGILERSKEVYARYGKYTATPQPMWRLKFKGVAKIVEFGSCQYDDDKLKYMGRAHDLRVLDEAANFLESQVEFISGWVRSEDPKQKCQLLLLSNPPTSSEGRWLFEWFAPWLDPKHPNPAAPGELRWFARVNGAWREFLDGRQFVIENGNIIYDFNRDLYEADDIITPKSRTFIPARVTDNPYYVKSGYIAVLQALPEPLRSQMLKGDFCAGTDDDEWQVIPTEWILQAQKRWLQSAKPNMQMTSLGVDVARGGNDKTVITPRYGTWFGSQIVHPGKSTPDSDIVAGLVFKERRHVCPVIVDIIGVGAAVYDALRRQIADLEERAKIIAFNASETSHSTDKSGQLRFVNKRAEWYWKLREALDPETGMGLALPDDKELLADLATPRWMLTARGIKIESKEEIINRIGRSPDKADSLIYAFANPTNSAIIARTNIPYMSK